MTSHLSNRAVKFVTFLFRNLSYDVIMKNGLLTMRLVRTA